MPRLPPEFLDSPESYSSVLPREYLEDGFEVGCMETVLMSPSEVRRLNTRTQGGSARRSGAGKRSRRNEEEELTPEQLAERRRNDRKARLLIC